MQFPSFLLFIKYSFKYSFYQIPIFLPLFFFSSNIDSNILFIISQIPISFLSFFFLIKYSSFENINPLGRNSRRARTDVLRCARGDIVRWTCVTGGLHFRLGSGRGALRVSVGFWITCRRATVRAGSLWAKKARKRREAESLLFEGRRRKRKFPIIHETRRVSSDLLGIPCYWHVHAAISA